MLRRLAITFLFFLATFAARPAMPESKFNQQQEQPLFIAVKNNDPEFAHAIQQAQATLSVFRALLAAPNHTPSSGAIRMVKTRIVEGKEAMWLWLNVEADGQTSFSASVFEAPPEFPSLTSGIVRTVPDTEIADWAIIDSTGLVNGGFSLRLQRSRRPEAERAAYDSYIGAKTYAPLPP
jgi:hypothetical protein